MKDEDFESRLSLRWGTGIIIEHLFRVIFRYRSVNRTDCTVTVEGEGYEACSACG